MLETPVKPALPQSEPWPAPPPDPTTRVIDTPPEPPFLAERTCEVCGFPLDADQAACLVCGSMVDDRDDRVGLRRAALSSASALLLVGLAVGAAVAGLPNGKHISKPPVPSLLGQAPSTTPPTTSLPSGRSDDSGPPKLTPLPGQTASAKAPPPIETSHPAPPAGKNASASTGTGSSGNTGGSTSPGGSGHHNGGNPGGKPKPPPRKPPLALFTKAGVQPAQVHFWPTSAGLPGGLDKTFNNKAGDAWTSSAKTVNLLLEPASPGGIFGVGIVSKMSNFTAEVWFSDNRSGPWTRAGSRSNKSSKLMVPVPKPGRDAFYYRLRVSSKDALSIAEIQFLQR